MKRSRVYLVGDLKNPRVRRAVAELEPWLKGRVSVTGVCSEPSAPLRPGRSDLVLILGGDGAILSAATRLDGSRVPAIGIRLGHFGFLAELELGTCREQLERIFAGEGTVVERFLLSCVVHRGGKRGVADRALNDAVITASVPARMVTLHLEVDGQHVATYRGDGLVVSTPVGSTAHSLAAGGPVVEPGSRSILVTPLAAHTLSSRPLVLDWNRRIVIRLGPGRQRAAALAMDGQRIVAVHAEDAISVRRDPRPFRMLTIVERSFFATLREKFQWSGSASLGVSGALDGSESAGP